MNIRFIRPKSSARMRCSHCTARRETIRNHIGICDKLGMSAFGGNASAWAWAVHGSSGRGPLSNRNLKDFTVDLGRDEKSGLRDGAGLQLGVAAAAFPLRRMRHCERPAPDAVLVGEYLMRAADQKQALDTQEAQNEAEMLRTDPPKRIEAANETKPDFIGFVFAESPGMYRI